ncbi:MAG: redoxin domain-containing protein [Mucilaginibacter sp.]|nr:redoxin domain-containing protein [Mucilaginibacter sp.]
MRSKMMLCLLLGMYGYRIGCAQQKTQALPLDPAVKYGRLANGFTYYIRHNESPKDRVLLYLVNKAGSILEDEDQRGLAHFMEALANYKLEYAHYPRNKADLTGYAYALWTAKDLNGAAAIAAKLAASDDEQQMNDAVNIYSGIGKKESADSVNIIIKTKFADAHQQKDALETTFDAENDPAKKEELYKSYVTKHPEAAVKSNGILDRMRSQLATAYLMASKIGDFKRIEPSVKDKSALAPMLNGMASMLSLKPEQLNIAADLSKQALDIAYAKLQHPVAAKYKSPKAALAAQQIICDGYADTYVAILMKQGRFAEAAAIEQPMYARSGGQAPELNEKYAFNLQRAGKSKEALAVMSAAYQTYKARPGMDSTLKQAYIKIKGSDAGFEQYITGLKHTASQSTYAEIAKKMINVPGPQFTLKDLDGNTVSLADLKGKVVVLDFWATWCGPCKRSFPGMQLAVNRYKSDPGVKFLFVDVWETDDNHVDAVKKYIAGNNYSFQVLLDEKPGNDGHSSHLTSQLDISSIPAKFILDGKGNIRFKTEGNMSTPEGLAEEVSAMIELARRPENDGLKGK